VSPGASQGLTVEGHPGWPDVDIADADASFGLVGVLVTRQERHARVRLCGWLVDVCCLGVEDMVGPRVMDEAAQPRCAGPWVRARPGLSATAGELGSWPGPSAVRSGRGGKPFFVQGPHDNADAVLETLGRSVGRGNVTFLVPAWPGTPDGCCGLGRGSG